MRIKISKRQEIARKLRQEILDGHYPEGKAMPGEHTLCKRFKVSYATMRLAIGDLEMEGLLERRHGSGTYASPARSVMPKSLGLLLLDPRRSTTEGVATLIHGASAYLDSVGSHLVLLNRPPDLWSKPLVRSLAGLLILPVDVTFAHLEEIDRQGLPRLFTIDNMLPGYSVCFNLKTAAAQVTRELLRSGHRRFAILSGHDENADRLRKEGIAETLHASGIDFDRVTDLRTQYESESAWLAMRTLLALKPRPTAIIAFDDTLALQAIRAAQESGLKVPRDLSVTGFNDAPHASLVTPSISTVRVPLAEAGRRAAELLCRAHLRGAPLENISIDYAWIERESTGTAPH